MGMGIGSVGSDQVRTSQPPVNSNKSNKPNNQNKSSSGIAGLVKYSSKKKNTKKKKLFYNFKKVSTQIMTSKTSTNAGKALTKARTTYIMLLIQQRSSEYSEEELKSALEHAEEMVRIAKKRKKHMEQEERVAQVSEPGFDEALDENEEASSYLESLEEGDYDGELSSEEMQEIAREIEEMTRESMEESLMDLANDLLNVSYSNMSDEEIEELKRKHRQEELRDIMEADMKYLKALFERLQREKQQGSSGSSSGSNNEAVSPVSLEIAGVDVPVQAEAAPVAEAEGAAVDVSV
ncbi:MAG: hypothetical protein J1D87_00390 [Lachnospiraceae bacterium]|nr:hypothetical protein [Lachnospiraceae bacterium]